MKITKYSKNAKKHPQKQIEQIANSIREFGMHQPIIVDKEGIIIIGHGRYDALLHLGWSDEEIMKHIKVVDLPKSKANAYRLADNKLNESDWDMELVIQELKSLSPVELDLTGFDTELILTPEEPENLDADNANKSPRIVIMFNTFEDMENAKVEIEEIIARYKGSYISLIGGGEL